MTAHWSDPITNLGACSDAVAWLRTQPDARTAWATCERGDWMLWLAGRGAGPPLPQRQPIVLAACDCAELALPVWEARYPDDRRPRVAIETARAWARGEATLEEVRTAAANAAAANAAAYAAATAATAATATLAAAAGNAAAYAATCAHAAAGSCVLRQCADIVRRYYPAPPETP